MVAPPLALFIKIVTCTEPEHSTMRSVVNDAAPHWIKNDGIVSPRHRETCRPPSPYDAAAIAFSQPQRTLHPAWRGTIKESRCRKKNTSAQPQWPNRMGERIALHCGIGTAEVRLRILTAVARGVDGWFVQ